MMPREEKQSAWMSMSQHDRLLVKAIQSIARDKSVSDFVFAESIIELLGNLEYFREKEKLK